MENYLIGQQGSFVLGYKIYLPEKFALGENDYDLLNDYWCKTLRDLPTGSIFFKQDIFKEKELNTEFFPDRNFLEKSTKDYYNGLSYLEQTTNIFFILPNNSIILKKLKNPVRPPQKRMFTEFDEKIKDFTVSVDQAIGYLKNIKLSGGNGITVEPLSKEYLSSYYGYINSGLNDSYDVDILNKWNYLRVGSQYASILKFPNEEKFPDTLSTARKDDSFSNDKSVFFKNYGDNFSFDLNFNHIYNQICYIDDNKKHYKDAQENNQNLAKFKKFDTINNHWKEKTDEMLKEMAENSDTERIIRGHNNIVVFANSENELENRINKVSEGFKDIDIREQRAFGDNLLALYEYSFPLNAHLFVDNHFYIANLEMFSAFLILTGKYNDDKEGVLYNSRLGNVPVTVDVWDEDKKYIKARNFFILAPTGFGKSFNANHIISHHYASGAKQVIIDLGGSYKKLAALFPNDTAYITYEEGDNLGINPFALGEGEKLTADKTEELTEFIGVHFKRDKALNEQERASLRKVIELYYSSKASDHSLPNFVKSFILDKDKIIELLDIKKEFFNVDEFVLLMSEFIPGGIYSFLYDSTNKIEFGADLVDKKIIIFELDRIRGNKLLLSVMLQLISTTIDKVIWRDKNTRGIILFDEVAEQLQWDGMLRRIQWFYQAIRKQNGSIGIVLQAVSQLPENPLSNSIIENTQVLYVLHAKDYRALQKRFDLSEHAYYQLCSIESNFNSERPYSEIFIMRGNKHQVYRLEVPKQVYWAYQTEGKENQKLMDIYEQEKDMEKAINIKISQK